MEVEFFGSEKMTFFFSLKWKHIESSVIKMESNTIANCARLVLGISCCRDRMKCARYLLGEIAVKDQKRGSGGGKEGLQITVQVRSMKEIGQEEGLSRKHLKLKHSSRKFQLGYWRVLKPNWTIKGVPCFVRMAFISNIAVFSHWSSCLEAGHWCILSGSGRQQLGLSVDYTSCKGKCGCTFSWLPH